MTNATVRFLDYPIPELRFYVSSGGRQKEMRKALRRACYKRRILLAGSLDLFLPYAIVQFHKLGSTRMTLESVRADMRYSIGRDEDSNITIRISGTEDGKKVDFTGYFFKWLGRSELVITSNKIPVLRGSVKQRRNARLAAIAEEYNKQHKGKHKFYTPLQLKMQRQRDKLITEHRERSEGAKRRHERKREARQLPADFKPEDDI